MKNIAVILAGSGYLDGAEIREAVGVLWALSPHSANVQCFAPDIPQRDVVDHITAEPTREQRNVLTEAARIARGKIKPLSDLDPSQFDALIMPGGFGAAKNLCTFAFEGSSGSIIAGLPEILNAFHDAGKPIGAACIAPAILALNWKNKPLELTVGATSDASKEIEKLGHTHYVATPSDIHVDSKNRIVTTPAYMYDDAPLHEVFDGIKRMVDTIVSMA